LVSLTLVALSWLPYLTGWLAAPPGAHFTGLLYNPLDGNSYLAKMRLGAGGSWLFRLAYTPEPQHGAPIYLFYLLLGHMARWLHLPLLAIYHGARTAGAFFLLLGIYRLSSYLTAAPPRRRLLFLLAATGAGLGWLAVALGRQTPDLWVAEAFPFAALLTNAHFPVALALMVWSAHWGLQAQDAFLSGLGLALGAVALGTIQPFGLLPLFGGLAGAWLASALRRPGEVAGECQIPRTGIAWTALAALLSLPYPVYTLWALRAHPVLAAWSAQNVTPSPSLWEWLLGLGLLVPLALTGIPRAWRRAGRGEGLLLGWVITTAVGLAVPLSLARRLSIGLAIPLGLLAGMGWDDVVRSVSLARRRLLTAALLALVALTPLFLLALGAGAVLNAHPLLYLSRGEWAALAWLREYVPHDQIVLCAPETGIFIPAWAGQRVVYGHPFETVDAEQREQQVQQFWTGEGDAARLDRWGVDLLFYGPREQALGGPPAGELLFEAFDTAVYRRQ